jgi:hypothetical protein
VITHPFPAVAAEQGCHTHLLDFFISPISMKNTARKRKGSLALWGCLLFIQSFSPAQAQVSDQIDLSGEWAFAMDPKDEGIQGGWFAKKLDDKVQLPGSMTTNGKGHDITVETPWTGSIVDSSYFTKPEYARFRQAGNIKVPSGCNPSSITKAPPGTKRQLPFPRPGKEKGLNSLWNAATGKPPFGWMKSRLAPRTASAPRTCLT